MSKRLLIDASYPEEARVAVISDGVIREFDHESVIHKPLKGNIYLAKIVRVEASLQAAFVDYGGHRDGFLPFNDIHPDYYKIPIADRDDASAQDAGQDADQDQQSDENDGDIDHPDFHSEEHNGLDHDSSPDLSESDTDQDDAGLDSDAQPAMRPRAAARRYRIQEVIRRNQIMLVQIVKEERGAKGAALTTRLSLAGRYCVLMPNALRGGGVSRKISNINDRRKIRLIMDSLDIPEGMAVIVRTAGQSRTKTEIRRDYSYLMRLWGEIRERTLQSTAPCLINEEGDLIKRSIRDLYNREMEEVLVNEESAYRVAKETMRMLMPSYAKRVKLYKEKTVPLFRQYNVEQQLDSIFAPRVDLQSGGYLIINQTEALVAIDVNSGRATRERSIEETALRTNLEAAEEIAWQLRLRDLAGLIVIDFIDMNERHNQNRVESQFKEALKTDRARTQVGKLSMFGLLEMSRQRLRPSLGETSTTICPSCKGSGAIRSIDSLGMQILRILEDQSVAARNGGVVTAFLPERLSEHMLNEKRSRIVDIEQRYSVRIVIVSEAGMVESDYRVDVESPGYSKTTVGRADSSSVPRSGSANSGSQKSGSQRSGSVVHRASGDSQEVTDGSPDEGAGDDPGINPEAEARRPERRPRRRGKRGGRRRPHAAATDQNPDQNPEAVSTPSPPEEGNADDSPVNQANGHDAAPPETGDVAAGPEEKGSPTGKRPRRRRTASGKSPRSPKSRVSRSTASNLDSQSSSLSDPHEPAPERSSVSSQGEKKTGWWQKLIG